MEIVVTRFKSESGCTLGQMAIDGEKVCYTLEDEVREPEEYVRTQVDASDWVRTWKVPGSTAIPRGRYRVIVNESARFGKAMPLLLDVPGFTGVRIHSGNTAADTEGCILVGLTSEANLIYKSRDAFKIVFGKIQAALAAKQEVFLTV